MLPNLVLFFVVGALLTGPGQVVAGRYGTGQGDPARPVKFCFLFLILDRIQPARL